MRDVAVAFGCALVGSVVFTPVVRGLAHRFGAVDHALSSRKVHARPTPRLGGVAIVTAFFLSFVALLLTGEGVGGILSRAPGAAAAFLVGGGAIAALGVYDDARGASAKLKFAVQIGVATIAYGAGFRIVAIANPFGPALDLGVFALPFTVCFIVGVTNAINLIDGLDGLAGGVAFFAALTFFVAAALRGETMTMWVTAAVAGAVLGFLVFNFNPASIFMGDTGSLFLGFILALSAIRSHGSAEGAAVPLAAPVLALGVPIGDTLLAIARRAVRGVPLFRGDRGHIHHKLLAKGLSQRGAVLVIYAASVVLGGAALLLGSIDVGPARAALLVVALAAGFVLSLRALGYLDIDRLQDTLATRQRNLRMRREMSQVGAQLRRAQDVDDIWSAVKLAVTVLDARWASVELVLDENGRRRTVKVGDGLPPTDLVRSRHGLLAERPEKGFLELAWPSEQPTIGRDAEIAIETFCEQVREALEGVVAEPARTSRPIALRARRSTAPVAPTATEPRLSRPSDFPPGREAA